MLHQSLPPSSSGLSDEDKIHAAMKKFADWAFRIKENSKNGNSKSGNLYG